MNNPALYDAVICGVGGSTQNLTEGQSQAANYTAFAAQAVLLATAVDNLILPITGGATETQANLMGEIVSGLGMDRFLGNTIYPDAPFHTLPSTPSYVRIAQSIVALWQALNGQLNNVPFGGNPLSNVVWVDGGTLIPTALQNGSIQTPYKTFTQAMASPRLATNGTIMATAGDYFTDGTVTSPVGRTLTIIAISELQQTNYESPFPVPMPLVRIAAFEFSGSDAGTSNLVCSGLEIPNSIVKPDHGIVQLRNCTVGTIDAELTFLYLDHSVLLITASVMSVNASSSTFYAGDGGTALDLDETVPSYLNACMGRTAMNWFAPSGTVYVDPWSYDVVNGVINGSVALRGLPTQTLIGTTVQEQLNSIASALVNLHLAIDSRTP
jgi:hypothetical protein